MWLETTFKKLTLADQFVTKDLFVSTDLDYGACMMLKCSDDFAHAPYFIRPLCSEPPKIDGSYSTCIDGQVQIYSGRMQIRIDPDTVVMQKLVDYAAMSSDDDTQIWDDDWKEDRRRKLIDQILKDTIRAHKRAGKYASEADTEVTELDKTGEIKCNECKGSGKYQGFNSVEDCRLCGGSGYVY